MVSPDQGASAAADCSSNFFGLRPWYHYLQLDDQCNIVKFKFFPPNSDVPLVLLAIIDDLLRIAGMVAVIFVVFGAIKFIMSDGNSDKATQARDTVINALIGLAVALIAIAFVAFLGRRLG
jgi:hypothetical protein